MQVYSRVRTPTSHLQEKESGAIPNTALLY